MKTVNKPEIFQVEASSICDLRCIMCPHPRLRMKNAPRAMQFLNVDLFKTIVDRDMLGTTKVFGFHILGESLLHKNLEEMIEYASVRGIGVELATNGTQLTQARSVKLVNSGLKSIWLSFDGGTKETYESIRVGANFEEVKSNIKMFLRINALAGYPIHTTIQMVGQKKNEGDLDNFHQLWKNAGADEVKVKFLDSWAGTLMLDEVPPPPKRTPCEEPFNRVAILANGDVVPCCRDWAGQYIYGNLNERSLVEIWNDAPANLLRIEHLSGNYVSEPCLSCREYHIPMNRSVNMDPLMEKRQPVQIPLYLQGEEVK